MNEIDAESLTVQHALQRVGKGLRFVEPKSDKMSLPELAITSLKRDRTQQKQERL